MRKKLDEVADVTKLAGFEFTKYMKYIDDGKIIAIRALNLKEGRLVLDDVKRIAKSVSEELPRSQLHKYDIVLSYTGTIGESAQIMEEGKYHLAPNVAKVVPKCDVIDPRYLFQYICSREFKQQMKNYAHGSTQPTVPMATIRELTVPVYDIETEKRIASILSSISDKIEKNREINENLLQQAQALYLEMFVNTPNESRKECRAEEYFDIAIGKTPPRKEHQWFTTNPTDVTWVSISDMGSCGTYISKSSEQLTQEAVDKFNIRVIPDNTVLLSFKLTVGRIAITHGEMTTNEAIAHFKTDKPYINEYLYCYLKDFNYQTMGSTSSIATAVNSKIIKAMPFIVPTDDEIARFHAVAGPIFAQILNNQLENESLAAIRDTLLPKLMSGELDVSAIDI